MPYNEIRAIDRSCGSYRPGHQVHWKQAKKAVDEQQPVIDVTLVVHDDGRVDIDGDDLDLTMWNHDPDRLRSVALLGRGGVEAAISRAESARPLRLRIQHGNFGQAD